MFSVFSLLAVLLFCSSFSFAQVTSTILASGPPLIDPCGIVISPDDATLFITDYSANAVFDLPAIGGTPTLIASGYDFENTRGITISPDGGKLFIAGLARGEVISIPSTGGVPTILASGPPLVGPHDIAISLDGQTLFIADNGAGAVFSLPVEGGSPTVLVSGPPFGTGPYGPADVCVSPDGSTLFIAANYAGIFSLPVTGGAPKAIESDKLASTLTLSIDGHMLFIFEHNPLFLPGAGGPAIHSLPVSGGATTLILRGPPLVGGGFMSVSHDGKTLYFADTGFAERYSQGPVGELGRVFSLSLVITATIDIDPDTLNLKSNGKFFTAYIGLPTGHNVADIDLTTVQLEGISAITDPTYSFVTDPSQYFVDHDGDTILERMVKFDRATVRDALIGTIDFVKGVKFYDITLKVTGKVAGTSFEGSDTIVVIEK